MAVPKRKTAKSKTKMRRAANSKMTDSRRAQTFKASLPGIVECPQCHDVKLPHRVCPSCGHYNGKEIVAE